MSELEPIELLGQLVAIDSQNPDPGERAVARHLNDLACQLGFATRIVEVASGRPNLIVTVDAGGPASLGLSGHMDTKPVGDALAQWRTPPLELVVDGDVGYGLGSSDMKAAVAAMLVAAQRWSADASGGRLELIFTADEEAGGDLGARALATGEHLDVDAVVIGEPSGVDKDWEAMYLVSRGVCRFDVVITGTQGHSGLSERLPTSASIAAARALLALGGLRPSFPPHPDYDCRPTVNPGVRVSSGVFYGVHPGHAVVACDIRLVPGMSPDTLQEEIKAALSEAMPHDVSWEVLFQDGLLGWTPAVSISSDHPLVTAAQKACDDVLGTTLPYSAYPGGTDATPMTYIAGIPCIASLGPGRLSVAHGPNECVKLSQVRQAVHLYEQLIRHYFEVSTSTQT